MSVSWLHCAGRKINMAALLIQRLCYVRFPALRLIHASRVWNTNVSNSKPESNEDEPVSYMSSKAASWQAQHSRGGGHNSNAPWYQGLVVSLSTATFLLYFCVFREENDVDEELGKTLYDRIEGLEECQLKLSLNYNKEHGLETKEIEQRLKEIKAL